MEKLKNYLIYYFQFFNITFQNSFQNFSNCNLLIK